MSGCSRTAQLMARSKLPTFEYLIWNALFNKSPDLWCNFMICEFFFSGNTKSCSITSIMVSCKALKKMCLANAMPDLNKKGTLLGTFKYWYKILLDERIRDVCMSIQILLYIEMFHFMNYDELYTIYFKKYFAMII